ncbi:MAG: CSLREA domain-containing protein, partial [Acidobacteria bacterium]
MGIVFVLISTMAVKAATYIVTKTADTNGTCSSGNCSLREAISAANGTGDNDTIQFNIPTSDPGCSGGVCVITLNPSFGKLTINSTSTSGTLTITNASGAQKIEISGNNAALVFEVASGGNLTINTLTIRNGTSGGGGGILNSGGILTVINSTISNNSANAIAGGGILNNTGATATIINSTISNNSVSGSTASGGGIANAGTITIINSTISNNSAAGTASANGGGIHNLGTATIINSTISNNSVTGGFGGGISNSGTVNARNTIIANNNASGGGPDFSGTINSQGNNLIKNTSGTSGTIATDITGQDPLLAPLADYGGPTKTHALLPGSPALNAGNNCVTTQGGCGNSDPPVDVNTDQRGNSRTTNAGGNVDIGAYEQRYGVVTNTGNIGSGSLRDEVTSFGGLITFNIPASSCPGGVCVITLSSQITINRIVILTNEGGSQKIEVSGNGAFRVFEIANTGNVTINSLTIRNGNANSGAAIRNSGGILNVVNSTINNNSATNSGAGIYNDTNATTAIINSTISNNSAGGSNGGGVFNNSGATLTIINSTISNNSAGNGGGVFNNGTVNVRNTIIANNNASVGPDFSGSINSQGNNLITNTSGITSSLNPSDIVGLDPRLAPLGDYGGLTKTHALLLDSPALNAGNNCVTTQGGCGSNNPPIAINLDQRGNSRTTNAGSSVDIGAYEQRIAVVTNTNNSGLGSLRDEATSQFGGLITFNISGCPGGTCIITLSSQITINRAVILTNTSGSQKIEISGGGSTRLFEVASGGNLTISNLTLKNGNTPSGGGSGILNNGILTVIDSTLTNNSASGSGGSIFNAGAIIILNSTIANSSTGSFGGGIFNASSSTATIINSTISNNSAPGGFGGGIYNFNAATLTIINSTVSNNSADFGGGINNSGGTVNARNTIIANNSAGSGPDFLGTINSQGSNLIKNTSGTSGVTSADITGQDPLLTPLGYYGGLTLTRAVFGRGWFRRTFSDSPVVDAGDSCVQVLNCASNN